MRSSTSMGVVVAGFLVAMARWHAPAGAAYLMVEDFEGLSPGPIGGQETWYSTAGSGSVVADPDDAANQVLAVTTNSAVLRRELLLPAGQTRMLFLRFRFAGQQNYSFGLSRSATPSLFTDFSPEVNMSNAVNDLRIRDDNQYEELATLATDTGYNLWLLIDNALDETQLYLTAAPGSDASLDDQLESDGQMVFDFRTGSAGDLRSFYIKTGGGDSENSGPLYLDDLYLESVHALNLHNPITNPVMLGDMNGDGVFDAFDVADFELALVDIDAYTAAYPTLDANVLGDFDASGGLDAFDVNSFEVALASAAGTPGVAVMVPVPEPGIMGLWVLGMGVMGRFLNRARR